MAVLSFQPAMTFAHNSVAEIKEQDLIAYLVNGGPWTRDQLLKFIGDEADFDIFTNVPLVGLPGNPRGDVDVLLVPKGEPERAAAIEVKRVKVSLRGLRNGQPNGLFGIRQGKEQARRLAKIGFSQVHLDIFVVVDGRERHKSTGMFDSMGGGLRSRIQQMITVEGLPPQVGLTHHEFRQEKDAIPILEGAIGITRVRPALSIEQPPAVTEWIARLVETRAVKR